jgi:hypothetical protein
MYFKHNGRPLNPSPELTLLDNFKCLKGIFSANYLLCTPVFGVWASVQVRRDKWDTKGAELRQALMQGLCSAQCVLLCPRAARLYIPRRPQSWISQYSGWTRPEKLEISHFFRYCHGLRFLFPELKSANVHSRSEVRWESGINRISSFLGSKPPVWGY